MGFFFSAVNYSMTITCQVAFHKAALNLTGWLLFCTKLANNPLQDIRIRVGKRRIINPLIE